MYRRRKIVPRVRWQLVTVVHGRYARAGSQRNRTDYYGVFQLEREGCAIVTRKRFTAEFKAKVALEALRGVNLDLCHFSSLAQHQLPFGVLVM